MQVRQMLACDYTLFPFTFQEVVNALEKIGFEINPQMPTPLPYGRFNGSGEVARKGKTHCVLNAFNMTFQMMGESVESTTDELNEFLATLHDTNKIDLFSRMKYMELQAEYECTTKKNPTTVINNRFSTPLDEEISDILGIKLKTITTRLGLAGEYPNQIEWFDIKMSPSFQRNDGYAINVIYRTADKEKYQTFVANAKLKIEKAIKSLEG